MVFKSQEARRLVPPMPHASYAHGFATLYGPGISTSIYPSVPNNTSYVMNDTLFQGAGFLRWNNDVIHCNNANWNNVIHCNVIHCTAQAMHSTAQFPSGSTIQKVGQIPIVLIS